MADSTNDVQALFEERRKYDGWLAALEARRESTPQHVFDRVKSDYQERLRQVEDRLSAHRHAITEERTSLASRRALLDAEEQLRRDERAELELRAHVGELASKDSDAAFKAVDEALGGMARERETLDARIAELDRLLEAKPADPSKAVFSEEPAAQEAVVEEPVSEPVTGEPIAEETPAEKNLTPGGSFDEVAFMSGIVGKDEGEKENESILDGINPKGRDEAPLASNIPSNTPIVLRSSGAVEQSKTLKCNECGAMNYPTEWYCERCGAELAAL